MIDFFMEQRVWSYETFGPPDIRGPRGPLLHLAKEAIEAANAPEEKRLKELADCLFLVCDGTHRSGFGMRELLDAAFSKLDENKAREWPDWRTTDPNAPVEHVRGDTQADGAPVQLLPRPQYARPGKERIQDFILNECSAKRRAWPVQMVRQHATDNWFTPSEWTEPKMIGKRVTIGPLEEVTPDTVLAKIANTAAKMKAYFENGFGMNYAVEYPKLILACFVYGWESAVKELVEKAPNNPEEMNQSIQTVRVIYQGTN